MLSCRPLTRYPCPRRAGDDPIWPPWDSDGQGGTDPCPRAGPRRLLRRLLTGDDGKRGYARNDVSFVQSDWFFASLLHAYRPDPLHVFG